MAGFLLLFACIACAGAVALVAGWRRLRDARDPGHRDFVDATIVRHGPPRIPWLPMPWRDRLRAPVVAWTAPDGTRREAACGGLLDGRDDRVGRGLRIEVDRDDPTRVRGAGQASTALMSATLLLAAGAMALLFGLAGAALWMAFR